MLLEIKNLIVHYDAAQVLYGISFDVEEGTIVTLLGNNGSGKSTTLRAISHLKKATSGEILFQGKRIDKELPQNIVRFGIGHVLEGKGLFPYMSVIENLTVGAYLRKDKKQVALDIEDIFAHFPRLMERRNQQARTLSGGEQQMLAIARSLLGKPKLLLLDEPSLGLSPSMVGEIGRIIRDINQQGVTVLLVEQNARLALNIAHKGFVFENGNIVLQGDAKDLIEDDKVRKAYVGR